tara:strand:+ start:442 stop:1023 length:582 start_codon:yes stop_codon:yes gene_type:complete
MFPILGIMASQISGHLDAGAYESIATVTVGSPVSSITFSSIAADWKHLQIRYLAASTRATYGFDQMYMRFNSDTGSNYSSHQLIGNGSSATAAAQTSATSMTIGDRNIGAAMPNTFGAGVIDVLDYQNSSKHKTARSLTGIDNNGTYDGTYYPYINFSSGLWQSTVAVNAVSFTAQNGDFKQYSSFALYGIKG